MSKQEYISRYLIIINYLKRSKATWADMFNHLQTQSHVSGYSYVISQRTFQRDINEISNLWNVEIKNNKSTGYYFIEEHDDKLNNNVQLLDTFNVYNALSLTTNYSNYIQFENRLPKGTEHIFGLLHAIKNKFAVELIYHKHYETVSEKVIVHPYFIKQFKGLWYLLCLKEEINEIRTYALDRIVSFEVKKKKFILNKIFSFDNYFKNCFGIITPSYDKLQRIVLSFSADQAKYIKNYPLHISQKIIKETDNQIIFEFNIFITYDFIMELLSYGDKIKIIEPKKLIDTIQTIYKNSLQQY